MFLKRGFKEDFGYSESEKKNLLDENRKLSSLYK